MNTKFLLFNWIVQVHRCSVPFEGNKAFPCLCRLPLLIAVQHYGFKLFHF